MAINLSDSIRVGQQKPIDDRYYNGLQPYIDEVEVCSLLSSALRYKGLTVNISGTEYWFKEGILDTDLILKESGGGIESVTGDLVDNSDPMNPVINNPDLSDYLTEEDVEGILEDYIPLSEKGAADGVVPLNSSQKIDSTYLPSYVDDVLEFADLASFPVTGESGKIYIALDTNFTYRWSGSAYVRVNEGVVLGETSTTAYRGDRGKTAYDHSQATGNPHNTTLQQVVDEENTVTDNKVIFNSVVNDSPRVTINNAEVLVQSLTDGNSTKIGVQEVVFEQGGNQLTIQPEAIDDDYVVTIQAKTHTVAGLDDIISDAIDIDYDNTTSGLDAENAQDAIDEVQGNIEQETTDRQLAIETAGFVQRTGSEIAFDKWATYDSYDSPSDGNFSYDLTNAVVGMIQVVYHEDSLVPTFSQVGLNIMITGEYQPDVVNKIAFELVALDRILINIKAL